MDIVESLKKRRTYYNINDALSVSDEEVVALVKELTELVPDAFNMKSSRVVVALGNQNNALWDVIYDAFGGKVAREKIDGFSSGRGTVLFFIDDDTVRGMQDQFASYADNFPGWALQASGMLQISIWSGLRELGIGASLQHYNPVIDDAVHALFEVPASYRLVAQMPFGGIGEEPPAKEREDIERRVVVKR
ncbi:MAG: nitroreductase family protein [Gordonibacter sp.]|nr:nitroreductase family protein [Gordonibacter sp.]